MLTVPGAAHRLCDGVTRRDALRIGALGLGGISLPGLLRAEQLAGIKKSHKAVIMIYMVGAPPHQDMYDLKMDAPSEIRGEFRPIDTAVPGIQICEHLPKLASIMDKLIPLRSVYGSPDGNHDSFICYTGRKATNQPPGGWPSIGSTISKVMGATNKSVPPFLGLAPNAGHPPYGSPGHPGYLGVTHSAFRPSGPAKADMTLNGIDSDRLTNRKQLLASFDHFRRDADASRMMEGLDSLNLQAMDILTSSRLVEALDISKEDEAVRAKYGKGDPNNYGDGAPRNLEQFLMARRLVEAGARVVTLNFGRWDFHSSNFSECKNTHFPMFDQGMHALIPDLHERGMELDVAVVAWGEFGACVVGGHKTRAVGQQQAAAFAAHRFADQKRFGVRVVQASGVELDEFHVLHPAARAPGCGNAVARGGVGVGGVQVHLARAAGGQERVRG